MRTLTRTSLLCLLTLFYGSASAVAPNTPFDSYLAIPWEDEQARLDNFAIQLQNYPQALGFILVFDKSDGCPGEARARAERAKRYVVEHRGVPWNRVIWRHEGYTKDVYTKILIAPPGAYVPYPYDASTAPAVDGPMTRACKSALQKIKRSRW
jgi:hypothetical protein